MSNFESVANSLMTSLTRDVVIDIPEVNISSDIFQVPYNAEMYKEIKPISNEDYTERKADGAGAFDAIMAGISAHLTVQYEKGRITDDDYAKAFIALTESALGNATQFLINRDASYWAAQAAQIQAITARVQLESEKARLVTAHLDALNAKSNYAISKAQLAQISVDMDIKKYNLDNILPRESAKLVKEHEGMDLQNRTLLFNLNTMLPTQHETIQLEMEATRFNLDRVLPMDLDIKEYQLNQMMPKEVEVLTTQIAGIVIDNQIKTFNLSEILPTQKAGMLADTSIKTFNLSTLMPAQVQLVKEQTEVQNAQTRDTRISGGNVAGTLGKQKDLYSQQIDSYKRSAEFNAAKIFSDAWITQKTLDEGLTPPSSFNNSAVDAVMTGLRTKVGI